MRIASIFLAAFGTNKIIFLSIFIILSVPGLIYTQFNKHTLNLTLMLFIFIQAIFFLIKMLTADTRSILGWGYFVTIPILLLFDRYRYDMLVRSVKLLYVIFMINVAYVLLQALGYINSDQFITRPDDIIPRYTGLYGNELASGLIAVIFSSATLSSCYTKNNKLNILYILLALLTLILGGAYRFIILFLASIIIIVLIKKHRQDTVVISAAFIIVVIISAVIVTSDILPTNYYRYAAWQQSLGQTIQNPLWGSDLIWPDSEQIILERLEDFNITESFMLMYWLVYGPLLLLSFIGVIIYSIRTAIQNSQYIIFAQLLISILFIELFIAGSINGIIGGFFFWLSMVIVLSQNKADAELLRPGDV